MKEIDWENPFKETDGVENPNGIYVMSISTANARFRELLKEAETVYGNPDPAMLNGWSVNRIPDRDTHEAKLIAIRKIEK